MLPGGTWASVTPSLGPLGAEGKGGSGAQGAGGVGALAGLGHSPPALDPQLISDGVPLVLAVVPHRQLHSSMTPDLLVSALGRKPPAPPPPPDCTPNLPLPPLLAGDRECQRAAGHPQLVAL